MQTYSIVGCNGFSKTMFITFYCLALHSELIQCLFEIRQISVCTVCYILKQVS